jgi:ferrochelatase
MGGTDLTTLPCLNDDEEWVSLLAKWIHQWEVAKTATV